MVAQVKEIIIRSRGALVEDLIGITALFVGLFTILSF